MSLDHKKILELIDTVRDGIGDAINGDVREDADAALTAIEELIAVDGDVRAHTKTEFIGALDADVVLPVNDATIYALRQMIVRSDDILRDLVIHYHMTEHHDGRWTACDGLVCGKANAILTAADVGSTKHQLDPPGDALVAAVAYRMQDLWSPVFDVVVRTAADVVQRGDWREFIQG